MKYFICLTLILLSNIITCMPITAQDQAKKKVAVYVVSNDVTAGYKKIIGSNIVSEIAKNNNNKYVAVERTSDFLSIINSETDYQTSGAVKDSQIIEIGQQLGVDYVAAVDITELLDELFISARLIEVQNGRILNAIEKYGSAKSMEALNNLSRNVATELMINNNIEFSKKPSGNYSYDLVVKNANGIRFFVTKEQYYELDGKLPNGYTKEGVYASRYNNGCCDNYIVPLFDSSTYCNWYQATNNYYLPNEDNVLIFNNDLDKALVLYGGEPLKGKYWTSTPLNSDNAVFYDASTHTAGYSFYTNGTFPPEQNKSNGYRVRELINVGRTY